MKKIRGKEATSGMGGKKGGEVVVASGRSNGWDLGTNHCPQISFYSCSSTYPLPLSFKPYVEHVWQPKGKPTRSFEPR